MKWYCKFIERNQDLLEFLQKLTDAGVTMENIKIIGSYHSGYEVLYYSIYETK